MQPLPPSLTSPVIPTHNGSSHHNYRKAILVGRSHASLASRVVTAAAVPRIGQEGRESERATEGGWFSDAFPKPRGQQLQEQKERESEKENAISADSVFA